MFRILLFISCLSLTSMAATKDKLVLTGSSTIAPVMLEIAKRFEKKHNGIRIDIQTGGSSRGINDAKKGLADIGMASRALKPAESNLKHYTIAVDGVAAIVNKENPVTDLTDEQLKKIFTGEIKNWMTVGGVNAPIVVVNRAEGRSELSMFLKRYNLKTSDIKAALIVGENAHGIKTISKNKNAITYLSIGHTLREAELGVPVKLLALNGIAANLSTVASGKFPFSRPLNLVVSNDPQGLVKSFLEYSLSKDVRDLIEKQSFVPTKY